MSSFSSTTQTECVVLLYLYHTIYRLACQEVFLKSFETCNRYRLLPRNSIAYAFLLLVADLLTSRASFNVHLTWTLTMILYIVQLVNTLLKEFFYHLHPINYCVTATCYASLYPSIFQVTRGE